MGGEGYVFFVVVFCFLESKWVFSASRRSGFIFFVTFFFFYKNDLFIRHKVLSEYFFCSCQRRNFFHQICWQKIVFPEKPLPSSPFKLNGCSLTKRCLLTPQVQQMGVVRKVVTFGHYHCSVLQVGCYGCVHVAVSVCSVKCRIHILRKQWNIH